MTNNCNTIEITFEFENMHIVCGYGYVGKSEYINIYENGKQLDLNTVQRFVIKEFKKTQDYQMFKNTILYYNTP